MKPKFNISTTSADRPIGGVFSIFHVLCDIFCSVRTVSMYDGISSVRGRTSYPCGRTEIRKGEVFVDVQRTEKGKSLTGSVCRHGFSYWSVSLQLRLQVFCLYVFCAHFWDPLVCFISRDEGNKCHVNFFLSFLPALFWKGKVQRTAIWVQTL
jgi:hypothetical protein